MNRAASTQSHVMVFQLSHQVCAIDLSSVREVVYMAELSRPPGLPAILEGFLMLGKQVVPVIDLRRVFGLPDVPTGLYTPLLILSGETCPVAVIVDQVLDVHPVSDADLMPVQKQHVLNDCVVADVLMGKGTVHILSVARLLFKQEQQRIAQLTWAEQERLARLT